MQSCQGALTNESEEKLIAAARSGDADSFDKLYLRYKNKIFSIAQRITKNRHDAEDVVQESFYKAYHRLDTFREESSFSTWITRIAMNEAFILLRKRKSETRSLVEERTDADKVPAVEIADSMLSPEEAYGQIERERLLAEAIGMVAASMRDVLVLRDIQQRSTRETATILAASIAATKSNLSRGRRKLRLVLSTRRAIRSRADI